MNLATIERMVAEGDLSRDAMSYLLSCRGECEWLDYKVELRLENDYQLCSFSRDVLAMKNVGGGYILVGVQDRTWEPVGLATPFPYDAKQLRDKVRKCTGADLDIDVVQHELFLEGNSRCLALVHIRSSKKRSKRRTPTVAKINYCQNETYGIRSGDIWIRKGDSTQRIASETELQTLLDYLDQEADHSLLEQQSTPSPFSINDGLYRLLGKGFDRFIGRQDLKARINTALLGDPRLWIINVHGPGGVGKSALVNWTTHELYAQRSFEAIVQLTAKETVLTEDGIQSAQKTLYSLENLLSNILNLFDEDVPASLEQQKLKAIEALSVWRTLVVLDNMETVSDGRIMKFVQDLPPSNISKFLLTSRIKTGGWEYPIEVGELKGAEVADFIHYKSLELETEFPQDPTTIKMVGELSGGLPLAIQWMIGQYRRHGKMITVVERATEADSPILEFSFGYIWNHLTPDARTILAIMSLFDSSCTIQQLAIASQYTTDRIEPLMAELMEVTLITKSTQQSDGRVFFSALPITLSFARHQLNNMGNLAITSLRRLNQFKQQMELRDHEIGRFKSMHSFYGLETESEKGAAILCRRAESEVFAGHSEQAAELFKQAKNMAPQSAYVLAMVASFELTQKNTIGARKAIDDACKRAKPRTGALCYTIKARILEEEGDTSGAIEAFRTALTYDPEDFVLRHQVGVRLSKARRTEEAIKEFSAIVDAGSKVSPETLLMAYTTRIINLRRLGLTTQAQADEAAARLLLVSNPHLEQHAYRFRQLIEG